jgi:23S rRNA (cytidine1920-2'-O)/16S rRNA (cytidine1409-2'-O)-methyltransferase
MKIRLDVCLVQQGLTESRNKAQTLIMTGKVKVNGQPVTKPGTPIAPDATIDIEQPLRYVSRGGLKLEGALDYFQLDVTGQTVLDVGASTGGFTDCLLQHGAKHVYCIDVGKHQLHENLKNHPQVTWKESFHVDQLTPHTFDQQFSWVVMDVSFISIHKVMPYLVPVLTDHATLLVLFKPQFEADKKDLTKGVLKNDEKRQSLLAQTITQLQTQYGFTTAQPFDATIKGPKGNQETILHLQR